MDELFAGELVAGYHELRVPGSDAWLEVEEVRPVAVAGPPPGPGAPLLVLAAGREFLTGAGTPWPARIRPAVLEEVSTDG